jgi:hypothetical protein
MSRRREDPLLAPNTNRLPSKQKNQKGLEEKRKDKKNSMIHRSVSMRAVAEACRLPVFKTVVGIRIRCSASLKRLKKGDKQVKKVTAGRVITNPTEMKAVMRILLSSTTVFNE